MVQKKKFEGQKIDVKATLHTPAAPKSTGPAWAKGAGAAAAAPPKAAGCWAKAGSPASVPARSAAPGAPGGLWSQGGPKGLAATATSVSAQAGKFAPVARPKPTPGGVPAKPKGGARSGAAPVLGEEAFPEVARPLTAAEMASERERAKVAGAFPEVSTSEAAVAALLEAAGAAASAGGSAASGALGWVLRHGLVEAPDAEARGRILHAGALVVEKMAGSAEGAGEVQGLLEAHFKEQERNGKNTPQVLEANGLIDAALFGGLAQKLEAGCARQASIRLRLLRRLLKPTTPACVQIALAASLQPLLAADESGAAAEEAYRSCSEAVIAAQEPLRRAGALGAAAAVKALGGAGALRRLGVMDRVKELASTEGKSGAGKRQGALLLLEALAKVIGRTFEPYALTSMPLLLECCSDSAKEVQVASRAAAQTVVAQVSGNGVRLMVNPLLEGLKDKRWRTQLSAVELLKPIVAELVTNAPKRLAAVMPKAIPALCDVAAGARGEVRDAARELLEQIGAAVDHTDVKVLVPVLVTALVDPAETALTKALDRLLGAVYTTSLDGPSCALICPVVSRGLARGDVEARQKAAAFVRTLLQLTGESEELAPYLTTLRPRLQALLSDPVPQVREAAAQAAGALASLPSGGGDAEADGASDLLARVVAPRDEAELEGAAKGLAAAMATLEQERREELLQELLSAEGERAARLGRLTAIAYLPAALRTVPGGDESIAAVLPVLRDALAADDEAIRNAARRGLAAAVEAASASAGACAEVASCLEGGLHSREARVRSTVAELATSLLGHRCFSASGSSAEPRAELVTAVVIAQADEVAEVRRNAERAWRAATEGAGGTVGKQLKDLRPRLLDRLVRDLDGGDASVASAAGRAGAQLQQRLETSGNFVEELLKRVLESRESSEDALATSVCVGLREVLRDEKCQKLALRDASLPGALRATLLLADGDASAAAAACIAVLPLAAVAEPLLQELCGASASLEHGEFRGLEMLLRAHSTGGLLSSLVARASARPHGPGQASCLAAAAAAPASVLRSGAGDLARACVAVAAASFDGAAAMRAIAPCLDAEGRGEAAGAICASIERGQPGASNAAGAAVLEALVAAAPAPWAQELAACLDAALPGGAQLRDAACAAAFSRAVQALVKSAGVIAIAEAGLEILESSLSAVASGPGGELAPEAFEVFAPIVQQGLVGAASQRQVAARASELLCRLGPAAALQTGAVKCAGPLVRALGDKASDEELQLAVLGALAVLLARAGASLRALVPTLQVSLLKSLDAGASASESRALRDAAVKALAALAPHVPKPEMLVKALGKAPLKAAHVEALGDVMRALDAGSGGAGSETAAKEAKSVLATAAADKDAAVQKAAAAATSAWGRAG